MRTRPFRDIFNSCLRLHGRDPRKNVNSDLREAIVEHINSRVKTICQAWRWPEWEITEERAFRQIWNATDQYLRVGATDGLPEEVFYLGAGYVVNGAFGTDYGYYRVKSGAPADPPIGTVPTNTTYWESFTPVDTFIAYDQRCRRSIGTILGVYSQNPRVPTGSMNGLQRYQPSERGIDVLGVGTPTVFISYKMPVPEYTMNPFVVGKTYPKGSVVLDYTIGECFQSLDITTAAPSDTAHWRRVPFPDVWTEYVVSGAFADSLMESDQGGNADLQAKFVLQQYWNQNADDALQSEVDTLTMQGQKLQWNFCKHDTRWCESLPFSGGSVSTLTSDCQDELGWVYPSTTSQFPAIEYHPEIVAIKTATDTPSLQQLATVGRVIGSIVFIKILVSGSIELQQWSVESGAANPADGGQQAPDDYNAITNDVHWEKIG